jgi:hypothetical protein
LREKSTLDGITEEERLREERRIRAERMELESLKAEQEEEKRKIIEQKKNAIIEKARQLGYSVVEEVRGNEKRYVFVRRS